MPNPDVGVSKPTAETTGCGSGGDEQGSDAAAADKAHHEHASAVSPGSELEATDHWASEILD